MPWETKRILVTVKTYPNPAKTGVEVSCTGGITREGSWIRLFPVPFRFLDEDKRFPRYAWIDASVRKASDSRTESYNLNPDSIQLVSEVKSWGARKDLVFPLKRHCLCCIKQEQETKGGNAPTLGIFKPAEIQRFSLEPAAPDWTSEQKAILNQQTLGFGNAPEQPLEKIPFDFKYAFRCDEAQCTGHSTKCLDWELYQAYRSWRQKYGDRWRTKFLLRFSDQMISKNDTHFYVGTIRAHPREWTIVGLFYPPFDPNLGLFRS